MKQVRKVLCIIGVGLISVFLAVSAVYACCGGMIPVLTDDPVGPGCVDQDVIISGTISATEVVNEPYSTTASVDVEITPLSGPPVTIPATLSNMQVTGESPNRTVTWDFSATYTPTEAGTYMYVKTGGWYGVMWIYVSTPPTPFEVEVCTALDIKPGSCPNPINRTQKGVVPVAIVGTENCDVTDVDVATIKLQGSLEPLRVSVADVTEPAVPDPELGNCYNCFEAPPPIYEDDILVWQYSGDGYPDLVMQFDAKALAKILSGAAKGDCLPLTLTATMEDGTELELTDYVLIVK